eukprot:846441-Prymnesium_polylepis.1
MSRTGRHRGGALRAWRDVREDVRGLPANPPRGSQIRILEFSKLRAHPPPGLAPIAHLSLGSSRPRY